MFWACGRNSFLSFIRLINIFTDTFENHRCKINLDQIRQNIRKDTNCQYLKDFVRITDYVKPYSSGGITDNQSCKQRENTVDPVLSVRDLKNKIYGSSQQKTEDITSGLSDKMTDTSSEPRKYGKSERTEQQVQYYRQRSKTASEKKEDTKQTECLKSERNQKRYRYPGADTHKNCSGCHFGHMSDSDRHQF